MPALQSCDGSIELQRGDAFHINQRRLPGLHDLQRFSVFIGVGQQQFIAYTKLLKQLPTSGALGGEIDEISHAPTPSKGDMLPCNTSWRLADQRVCWPEAAVPGRPKQGKPPRGAAHYTK